MTPGELWVLLGVDFYMLAALLACCLVTGHGLTPRSLLPARLSAAIAVECLWAYGCSYQWLFAPDPLWGAEEIVIVKYLGTFLLTVTAFRFCLRCGWTAALYGGTTGYILQHCAERTTEVVWAFLPPWPSWAYNLILAGLTALACLCFIFAFRRRYDILEYDRYGGGESNIMLVTAAAVVGVVIVLEPIIRYDLGLNTGAPVMVCINIISVLLSLLALVVSMCQMRQAESQRRAQIAEQLLHAERGRYTLEKETVDAINIRCHDIKHQIAALGDVGRQKELREIERLVNIYDCGLKTECAALDLVLSNKSLMCARKRIVLTCVADGRRLGFMEEADIYALFGNILDNAIEAADRVEDREKRLISLTVRSQGPLLIVTEENYHDSQLVLEGGLPVTTKADKRFHGFGMQSIKMLTEKYGGDLRLRSRAGIYRLSILFPIVEDVEKTG